MIAFNRVLRARSEGFSLIEVLVSIFVFSLVTVGLVPLILTSLRGSELSRSYTVSKNIASEAMERVRGLPFHRQISEGGDAQRVDVLDLYFPRGFGAGFFAADDTFTTTCTPTTDPDTTPACGSVRLPTGYEVTFVAEFVEKCDAAVTATCDAVDEGDLERYQKVDVANTYFWQGAASGPEAPCAGCSDNPPSEILRMSITATFDRGGTERSFTVTSLISDRNFGGPRIDAEVEVDHLIQLSTSFNVGGQTSELRATAGTSNTRIEVGSVASAEHSARGARAFITDTALPDVAGDDEVGASIVAAAPPDVTGLSSPPGAAASVSLLDLGNAQVAGFDTSEVIDVDAGVAVDLPQARGTTLMNDTVASPLGLLWMNGQVDVSDNPLRLFAPGTLTEPESVAWLRPSGATDLSVFTEGTSTAEDASPRHVTTMATAEFGNLRLFPVDFIPAAEGTEQAVLQISDYSASITCSALADDEAGALANSGGSYSATLSYWQEELPNDGLTEGGYQTIALEDSAGLLALRNLHDTLNDTGVMVYEEPDEGGLSPEQQGRAPEDIYLFPVTKEYEVADVNDVDGDLDFTEPEPDVNDVDGDSNFTEPRLETKTHEGYLSEWASLAGANEEVRALGRAVNVDMDSTFTLLSQPLTTDGPSSIALSVGAFTCKATDLR